MFSIFRLTAPLLLVAVCGTSLLAETQAVPAPPAWNDRASVYLLTEDATQPATASAEINVPPYVPPTTAIATTPAPTGSGHRQPQAVAATHTSAAVEHAVHHTATESADDAKRLLAPPPVESDEGGRTGDRPSARAIPKFGLPWESLITTAAALAIVVGLLLCSTWILGRGARKNPTPLPADVVSVVGRMPLAARHFAQLLRVGNKLVLVSMTSAGAQPITEVTDPAEVDRLVGLCQQANPHSTTKAFEQVFRQLSSEPAPDGFLGTASFDPQIPGFELHRGQHGETGRV